MVHCPYHYFRSASGNLHKMTAKKTAAWVAICASCVAGAEGLRTYAYRDPVGIPTICFGETKGVRMGDKATADECKDMLIDRVQEFGDGVDACVKRPLPNETKAAFTSFAYNVGVAKFCGSTMARKAASGDLAGACNELPRWNKANGVPLPGLTNRREKERELCIKGLA